MIDKGNHKLSLNEEIDNTSVHNVFQDNLEFAYKNYVHSACINEGKCGL
jgi:hypothetical protein